jgi:glycosyltransferase involved in cell wall biosynthesis
MQKPVVAHLLPPYNPFPPKYAAGTELRVEKVSMRQQRYRPIVVCGGFPGELLSETVGQVTIRRIRFSRLYRRVFQKITRLDPWPYAARMSRIIDEEQASLIHIHNEPKVLEQLAGFLKNKNVPVAVHVANEKPLSAKTIPLVTRWVACSQYIKNWLVEKNGIAADKVDVIYTGVDWINQRPWWELPQDERQTLRMNFGIKEQNAIVFLFAGRLVKEKGVLELIDAFSLLQKKSSRPIYLLIAGNVKESDDPKNEKAVYGKQVLERLKQAGERIRWIGSLPPDEVNKFLVAGDIFMLPALWHDPFPTSLVEAAAAGLPTLASARGGIPELLAGSPVPALLEHPEDAQYLCDRMLDLINNESGRLEYGRWLRQKVEKQFGWERVTHDFEALYDQLLPHPLNSKK